MYFAFMIMLFLGVVSGVSKLNDGHSEYPCKNLLDFFFPGSF